MQLACALARVHELIELRGARRLQQARLVVDLSDGDEQRALLEGAEGEQRERRRRKVDKETERGDRVHIEARATQVRGIRESEGGVRAMRQQQLILCHVAHKRRCRRRASHMLSQLQPRSLEAGLRLGAKQDARACGDLSADHLAEREAQLGRESTQLTLAQWRRPEREVEAIGGHRFEREHTKPVGRRRGRACATHLCRLHSEGKQQGATAHLYAPRRGNRDGLDPELP